MGCTPRTRLLQGRSSPFAARRENIQGSARLGGHSWEDSGPPTRAGRTRCGAWPDEPHPSLAAPASSGSRGKPPLPFLQRGIIAAHDAARVIAAGLGARAAPAFSPPGRGDNSICPPPASTQRGGEPPSAPLPSLRSPGDPPGWGEWGGRRWGALGQPRGAQRPLPCIPLH